MTVAFVQARMGSTRLAGKVLAEIEGKPVLEHVLTRAEAAPAVDEVVVVTTIEAGDLPILRFCADRGTRVYAGSEDDVLDRYYQAARLVGADQVIRITADCPLLDPGVLEEVVQQHLREGADYTSNVINPTFPDGLDVEVLTFKALHRAWNGSTRSSEREHVTLHIRNNEGQFRLSSYERQQDLSSYRWTLDQPEDLEFVRAVYSWLGGSALFGMQQVLELLRREPELTGLNTGIGRNEGLAKSLREEEENG